MDCIMDSFHDPSMLADRNYLMQVTKECYAFGIHLDDYQVYWPTNERPVYVRKYPRNNVTLRSTAFTARKRSELQCSEKGGQLNFWMCLLLVSSSVY